MCPYLGERVPLKSTTPEHIFPECIGGGLSFSVPVEGRMNSEAGSKIDAPFVDSTMIRFHRMRHELKNKSGDVPAFRYETKVFVPSLSRELPIKVDLRKHQAKIVQDTIVFSEPRGGRLRVFLGTGHDEVERR